MPRIARIVVPGMPHHLTHRGVRRSDVFWDDADRLRYLELLRVACVKFFLRVWAYCLMTNHIHLVAVPERVNSIAKVFHWTHGRYGEYFNKKYDLTGNLWEDRPHSSALDEGHALNAVRYVEQNPVRAGMVLNAWDYRWSSARVRCGLAKDTLVDLSWPSAGLITDWEEWLQGSHDPRVDDQIRKSTATGRPCGDDSFVRTVEALTNRRLSRKKPGPKPKTCGQADLFAKDEEQ
jgi:putative transposase